MENRIIRGAILSIIWNLCHPNCGSQNRIIRLASRKSLLIQPDTRVGIEQRVKLVDLRCIQLALLHFILRYMFIMSHMHFKERSQRTLVDFYINFYYIFSFVVKTINLYMNIQLFPGNPYNTTSFHLQHYIPTPNALTTHFFSNISFCIRRVSKMLSG